MINQFIKLSVAISMLAVSTLSFADIVTLKKAEDKIIEKYKDSDFFEVNGDIMSDILEIIDSDPDSFKHNFSKFKDVGYLQIEYSDDKKLKFYTFDVSGGGTMGEWQTNIQYKIDKDVYLKELDGGGSILKGYKTTVNQKPIYLIQSYYKYSSCYGAYALNAIEVTGEQVFKSYIFEDKSKKIDEIIVEYSCSKDKYNHGLDYFRIGPETVDVLLLNKDDIPQNKYLRYSLQTESYKYIGVTK